MSRIFSAENKPFKLEVQNTVAGLIYYATFDSMVRANGMHVVTLAGDALKKCSTVYKRVMGKSGKMISIEKKDKVFKLQQKDKKKAKLHRVEIRKGDFLTELTKIVNHGHYRRGTIVVDLDMCGWLEVFLRDELRELRKVTRIMAEKYDTVWFSITYCRSRGTNTKEHDKHLRTIHKAWRDAGFKCETTQSFQYRDAIPMGVTVWKWV